MKRDDLTPPLPEPKQEPSAEQLMLDALDDTARAVSGFTGMKQQFVDAGWTPFSAEQMVIAQYKAATGQRS